MNKKEWSSLLKPYESKKSGKSIGQLILTLVLYLSLLALMLFLVFKGFPYWMTLILALPAAGFHVKLFIIMHDCGHGSYFKSRKASDWAGRITGILTHTPYYDWRRAHAIHHATVSNLEKRGVGDIWTMTVNEFQKASRTKRLIYRIYRFPLVLFGIGPSLLFMILFRFPHKNMKKKDLLSILLTDLFMAAIIVAFSFTLGFMVYLKVILPIVLVANMAGVWLFYVQHQFEDVNWYNNSQWNVIDSSLKGSSYYKLPTVLRWLSGNIGLHHIHHLNARIPNYNLQKCYNDIPQAQEIVPITLLTSLKSLFLKLWDEESQSLISYKALRNKLKQPKSC